MENLKIKILSKQTPSESIFKEALGYLNEDPKKEKFLFHKHRSHIAVYKEIIDGKTYYIKTSKPKTISRAIKKRLKIIIPRAVKYYHLSEKISRSGINVVSPDYVFLDNRYFFFRKNISFSQDFSEVHNIKGDYLFLNLLNQLKGDEEIFDKWIYKYLDIIIKMTNSNLYHRDPNFLNFFYKEDTLYMIDLDDIKELNKYSKEAHSSVEKSLYKYFKSISCPKLKIEEYLTYFKMKT